MMLFLVSFNTSGNSRDSLTWILRARVIEAQLVTAGSLSELNQYRLENPWSGTNADSLFVAAFQSYEQLYPLVPDAEKATVFPLSFYEHVFPAVQRFRSAGAIIQLTEHREQLHPTPPAPDPKHDQHSNHPHDHQ